MTWTEIKAAPGMGLEAQHLLRWHDKPVCSLKEASDGWRASLLNLSGLSAASLRLSCQTLEEAKRRCEHQLNVMGWRRPGVASG